MRVSETPVCTYDGCKEPGDHEQVDRQGDSWAHLCDEHAVLLDNALTSGKAPVIMKAWIKCQGGSKAAAKRMVGG